MDGDGDLDVLSASQSDDKIAWYENDGAGTFGSQQVITTAADFATSVYSADVDGDGDIDVLSASSNDAKVAWYENDGAGTFGSQQVITTAAAGAASVFSADVDGDGDLDVLSASISDDKIAWYENETIHRSAAFPAQQVITTAFDRPYSVSPADVDGDGDPDVLSASPADGIAWFENTDGAGAFGSQQVITTGAEFSIRLSASSADVDGDGDLDVLSALTALEGTIAWYENTDGAGTFGSEQVIPTDANFAFSTSSADLDGDGDLDVLSGLQGKIVWNENTDGAGTFGSEQVISSAVNGLSVSSGDVDGDGDLDVLSTFGADGIAWFENTDGAGTFSLELITTDADLVLTVLSGDVDGDGDLDVLSATADSKIAWYENTDGAGTFGSEQVITTAAAGAFSVFSADVDGDGDLDVLSATQFDGKISWYENTDSAGTFGSEQVITTAAEYAYSVSSADVDGDGELDVLSASGYYEPKIAWYENRGGQFALGTTDVAQQVVGLGQVEDVLAIEVTHRGREGDSPLELASLDLRLTSGSGTPLNTGQAMALFQTIRVYLDDGTGVFDAGDSEVISISDFSSIDLNGDGVLTVELMDGDPNAEVVFGTPKTFLVVAELTDILSARSITNFKFEHRTESSSSADDATADIPLTLEFVENFQGVEVDTELTTETCKAPFDLNLESQTIDATAVCEAGTVLRAGSGFVLVSPGDLTFRAGQGIELADEFEVQGGSFSTEIDPELEP